MGEAFNECRATVRAGACHHCCAAGWPRRNRASAGDVETGASARAGSWSRSLIAQDGSAIRETDPGAVARQRYQTFLRVAAGLEDPSAADAFR